SKWEHQDYDNPNTVDIAGKVIESTPPNHLVLTWAFPADLGVPEKTSRVTFRIEPYMDIVRLTVTHDELEPDSPMLRGISKGWPYVLSSLKTMLETGQGLPKSATRISIPE